MKKEKLVKPGVKDIISISKVAFKGKWRLFLIALLLFVMVGAITPILEPFMINIMFDSLENGNYSIMIRNGSFVLAVTILQGILTYFLLVYLDPWADSIIKGSNIKLIKRTSEEPYGDMVFQYEKGDILNRINEISNVLFPIYTLPFNILSKLIAFIYFGFLIRDMKWEFWSIAASITLFYCCILKIQVNQEKKYNTRLQECQGKKEELARNLICDIEFYRMNDISKGMKKRYDEKREELFQIGKEQMLCEAFCSAINETLYTIGKIGLAFAIYPKRMLGILSTGVSSALFKMFDNIMAQIQVIRSSLVRIPSLFVPVQRFFEILGEHQKKEAAEVENSHYILARLQNFSILSNHKTILDSIDLTLYHRDKVAIIGMNGSGKSTLLRALLGMFEKYQTGEIFYYKNKKEISSEQWRENISYIPANSQLLKESAAGNLESGGIRKRGEELIRKVMKEETEAFLFDNIETFSGGQKQLVNIGRAVSMGTELLIADECCAGLDIKKREQVLAELIKDFETIIAVTHFPDELKYFDRIILMKQGKIQYDGTYKDIQKDDCYQEWISEREQTEIGE